MPDTRSMRNELTTMVMAAAAVLSIAACGGNKTETVDTGMSGAASGSMGDTASGTTGLAGGMSGGNASAGATGAAGSANADSMMGRDSTKMGGTTAGKTGRP